MSVTTTAQYHLPRLVYSGNIGRHSFWRDTLPHGHEGVYHLFNRAGEIVYVGKTCNPFQRFIRHRDKSWWWTRVDYLNFYTIGCEHHLQEPCERSELERLAFYWEAHAISALQPLGNTVGIRL